VGEQHFVLARLDQRVTRDDVQEERLRGAGAESRGKERAQQARVVEDGVESIVAEPLLRLVGRLLTGLREQREREVGVCTCEARPNVRDQHVSLPFKNDEPARDGKLARRATTLGSGADSSTQ